MSSSTENRTTPKLSFVRRLLADTQGTATTETVIMIPMFAIVWGCIFFVFTFFQRTIAMRSMTRGHTWQYAYVGCNGSGPGTTLNPEGGSVITATASGEASVDGIIAGLFALSTGHGRRESTVTRPTILGGGSMTVSDDLFILCNVPPSGTIDYLARFASEWLGFS